MSQRCTLNFVACFGENFLSTSGLKLGDLQIDSSELSEDVADYRGLGGLGGIIPVQTECEYDLTLSWMYSRTSKLKDAIGDQRQGWPMKNSVDVLTRNVRSCGQNWAYVWGLTLASDSGLLVDLSSAPHFPRCSFQLSSSTNQFSPKAISCQSAYNGGSPQSVALIVSFSQENVSRHSSVALDHHRGPQCFSRWWQDVEPPRPGSPLPRNGQSTRCAECSLWQLRPGRNLWRYASLPCQS